MDADAIVIGAGAAGLAAARSLAARSLRVIVVEARDRIGGRVWTLPSPRSALGIELGAEFIHGPAPQTTALLRDAGTAAVDTGGDSWTLGEDGELHTDAAAFEGVEEFFEGTHALSHDESVDRFLQRSEGNATLQAAVREARAFVEGFEAADPALASAQAIASELRSGVDSQTARPLGGYRAAFERLHDACASAGVTTYLSTPARRIAWQRGSVAIDVERAFGEAQTLRARAAIVTVSAGVLRHHERGTAAIAFDPGLPAEKRAALAHVEMGHAIRVALSFRSAFWERVRDGRYRDAAFFRSTGLPFTAYWTQVPVRSELVVAWAGGPKAVALRAGASEAALVGIALESFGTLLREPALARAEFERGAVHDWSGDPYARGAYSYVAVGGGEARAGLGAPVDDTLFFAGEATATDGQGGTVSGALATGERAAREAAAVLTANETADA